MLVNRVKLMTERATLICNLSFRDPGSDNPYLIKAIDGLDAPVISPNFYGIGGFSRVKFYNMKSGNRDIVFRIGLNPDWYSEDPSFSKLRDELFSKLVSTRSGVIRIFFMYGDESEPDGGISAYTYGHVTKLEATYEAAPEVQITVTCKNPNLLGLPRTLSSGGEPETFPLEPEENNTLIVMDNISTAPHGFSWAVGITEATPYISMHETWEYEDWEFRIVPGVIDGLDGFQVGDIVAVYGQSNDPFQAGVFVGKQVFLERGGITFPIADKIMPGSMWPVMFPGSNHFVIDPNTGNFEWLRIGYTPEFWGV